MKKPRPERWSLEQAKQAHKDDTDFDVGNGKPPQRPGRYGNGKAPAKPRGKK